MNVLKIFVEDAIRIGVIERIKPSLPVFKFIHRDFKYIPSLSFNRKDLPRPPTFNINLAGTL